MENGSFVVVAVAVVDWTCKEGREKKEKNTVTESNLHRKIRINNRVWMILWWEMFSQGQNLPDSLCSCWKRSCLFGID
jgi:hypothetical protein